MGWYKVIFWGTHCESELFNSYNHSFVSNQLVKIFDDIHSIIFLAKFDSLYYLNEAI
jgi:hypothetical protein